MNIFLKRKIRRAQEARKVADKAMQRAVWSKNTQYKRRARKRMEQATHDALKLELRLG